MTPEGHVRLVLSGAKTRTSVVYLVVLVNDTGGTLKSVTISDWRDIVVGFIRVLPPGDAESFTWWIRGPLPTAPVRVKAVWKHGEVEEVLEPERVAG